MRVFLDTNILISSVIAPGTVVVRSFVLASDFPNEALVSDYVFQEFFRKCADKFPDKTEELNTFLSDVLPILQVVATPSQALSEEDSVVDVKDRPILRAALVHNADILLTGDPHLLNVRDKIAGIEILNPAEFLSRS